MRIKKFIASNLQEGKAKILKELGEDAVVLSTRNIKKTDENDEDLLEIIAVVDEISNDSGLATQSLSSYVQRSGRSPQIINNQSQSGDMIELTNQLFSEISSLKEILFDISDSVKYKYAGSINKSLSNVYKILIDEGFSEEYSLSIIGSIGSAGYNIKSPEILFKQIRELITNGIKFVSPLKKSKDRQIYCFAGPTGSGKTTTLVKLAVICKLVLQTNVLIISADTHKVGGSEQLQSYASIIGIDYRSCYTPDELKGIIKEEHERNFILVDTTGRNHLNQEHMEELREYLNTVIYDYSYLVTSAAIDKTNFGIIVKEFSKIGTNAIILTKIDESPAFGGIIEKMKGINIPLSYITSGQQIPEDIEPVSKDFIGKLIFPDKQLNLL